MTISNVDQMYRVEQMSDDGGPMFPKGPKQMLGFVFSMEGEVARQQTWHAKMIALRESFESGYIRPFSLHKINLRGLSPLEINGECAGMREMVRDILWPGSPYDEVVAKFGIDEMASTILSVEAVSYRLRDFLNSGLARRQRSLDYCSDLVWHECCGLAKAENKYSVTKIQGRHGVSQNMVSRDCDSTYKYFNTVLSGAYKEIKKKFADGVVLSLRE